MTKNTKQQQAEQSVQPAPTTQSALAVDAMEPEQAVGEIPPKALAASSHEPTKKAGTLVQVCQVALLTPPFTTLSYLLPQGFSKSFWRKGLRLAVPLGRMLRGAIILQLDTLDTSSLGYELKELIWPLESTPLVSEDYLEFAAQFALRQAQSNGRILASMLPSALRNVELTLRFFEGGKHRDLSLKEIKNCTPEQRANLATLWEAGQGKVLQRKQSLDDEIYCLKQSSPWPVKPSAHKQLALLDFLAGCGQASRRRLQREFGQSIAPTLKTLTERQLIELRLGSTPADGTTKSSAEEWLQRYGDILSSPAPFELNTQQQLALNDFCSVLDSGKGAARLLYGVTGSGKTAVYLELAAKVLQAGRSVLLLAPEVALAMKLRNNAQERFPGLPVYLSHGYQPQSAREILFKKLAQTKSPALVVGTRSALFLQLPNIGAIVIDEEHDSSFKQDERLSYQAKDLAWHQMQKHGALLVLGSATPDLKTFYAVEQGVLPMHRLSQRAGGGSLPQVQFVVMGRSRGGTSSGSGKGVLADESSAALQECVKAGNQAVILLNRRGYSPSMYCLSCGVTARCPNCDVALSYHKGREKLVCHYCGHSLPFPSPCTACKSMHFLPMGEGTEKLEERLNGLLPPGTKVLRLDRDSTSRPGAMEEILRAFGRGEAEVLVGTQMLSKGHHFPRVTLAIIADGDLGLSMPDYNAAERTFQLILQASGRSGRGDDMGKVIIQTRDPYHYCWEFIKNNDYEGFYHHELGLRQKRRYPPFVKLALVRFSFPVGWADGMDAVQRIGQSMQKHGKALGVMVLGPAPAPHYLRDRQLRFQCLLKAADWNSIRGLYTAAANMAAPLTNLKINLDIDPATML